MTSGRSSWKKKASVSKSLKFVALTTNFDDLLTDAFFFQEDRPLVIHHDSLAPFIRPTHLRPLLVKLHGDHQLAPRNTCTETDALAEIVSHRISTVLHDRGIIFVGYGGNDESIIAMLEDLPAEALPFGVYWVSGSEPRGIFRPWLESRGAVWVEHKDFDELMLLLKQQFTTPDPSKERYERVYGRYLYTQRKLAQRIAERPRMVAEASLLRAALSGAVSKTEPDFAQALYERALKESQDSGDLLGGYATFLADVREDPDRAEEF